MSWSYIFKLAISISIAQMAIGFLDGFFAPSSSGISWTLGSHAVSLSLCGAIFVFFAFHQPFKPFLHAWISLPVGQVAGLALLLPVHLALFGTANWPLQVIVVDLLVVVCALIVGTLIGIGLRTRLASQPDA